MDIEIVVIFNNDDFGIFSAREITVTRYQSRSGFQTDIETIRHVTCEVKFIV